MNGLSIATNRLIWFLPTLFGLLVFVFVLSRAVPVDPAVLVAGESASAEQVQQARQRFGLDQPLPTQFVGYLADLARGDLGTSLYTQQSIADDLLLRLPATLELTLTAVLLSGLIGVPLGVLCGVNRNSWFDHGLRLITVSCTALAAFWIAMHLQLLFAMKLDWFPLSGRFEGFPPETTTRFLIVDALITGDGDVLVEALWHIALPALALTLPAAAIVTRFTRNGVINALSSPSVAYQTAMGLPRRVIVWKYALRTGMIATVNQLGLIAGNMLTGAVVVETIFDWPGLGCYTVHSILHSDYNAVMGITLSIGAIFAVINLVVDMVQATIDPRGATP